MFKTKNKNKEDCIAAKPKIQSKQKARIKQSMQPQVSIADSYSEFSEISEEIMGHLDCTLLRYTENKDLSYQKAMMDIISPDIPPMESNTSSINYDCITLAIRGSNNHNVTKLKPKDFTESFKITKTTGNEEIEVDIL